MSALRRLVSFYRRHGMLAAGARCFAALHRSFYRGRMVLFSCPLPIKQLQGSPSIPVECVTLSSLPAADYARMLDDWDPENRAREMAERFAAGSELWLARAEGRLAGFGWTIVGRTIEPHFFALKPDEVHLFDFFVYPEFRGRGINVALVTEILAKLGGQKVTRAHIECAAWNHPQIRSLGKTAFRRYATATKVTLHGHTRVIWHRGAPLG